VGLATPFLGGGAAARSARSLRDARGAVAQHVTDSVQGVREVLAFAYAERRLDELAEQEAPISAALVSLGRLGALRRGLNTAVMALAVVAEFALLADGGLDRLCLGLAVTVAAFVPVLAVEDFAADLHQAFASARRIFEITDQQPLVPDTGNSQPDQPSRPAAPSAPPDSSAANCDTSPSDPGGAESREASLRVSEVRVGVAEQRSPVSGVGGAESPRATLHAPEVRFKSVTFSYPGALRTRPALADVGFTVPPGKVTALVGASGSGKSTAAMLLVRAWEPNVGEITLDGRPLAEFPLSQLRAEVGTAPQRPYLFNTTIRENLLLARPDATQSELERAAALACLDEVVHELPDGWDTEVGELGERLSGGQRQRLALARTLLRDPSVLILDETTSQLDPATESRMLARMKALTPDRTVLMIAHRLSTVRDADQILVLDGGVLLQQGSYATLAAIPGPFATLLARESGDCRAPHQS
jgi:ABC-type multidrug transport system fused ATPase/permease subunit